MLAEDRSHKLKNQQNFSGAKSGCLTDYELNDSLPQGMVSSTDIDSNFIVLDEFDIVSKVRSSGQELRRRLYNRQL